QKARRRSRATAPRQAGRQAHEAYAEAGRVPGRPRRGAVQARVLPVLGPARAFPQGKPAPRQQAIGRAATETPAWIRSAKSPSSLLLGSACAPPHAIATEPAIERPGRGR